MNTSFLQTYSVPRILSNIPFGKIIVFTDPESGITSKTIQMIEFILSMARHFGKSHNIEARPVDCPDLQDCYACRVNNEDGTTVLVADKESLIEMLCELWGLDYEDVCKTYKPSKRNSSVPCGGSSHPFRFPIKTVDESEYAKYAGTIMLEMLQEHTRENTFDGIRSTFQNIFAHNIDISIADLTALYEEVRRSMKSYKLNINVVWNHGDGWKRIKNCDISLVDNNGNSYPVQLEIQLKALYLTYIMFKDGLPVIDIASDKTFYAIYTRIVSQLPGCYKIPDQYSIWENAKSRMSRIRNIILTATNDAYAKERFSIDGPDEEPYKVAGATDEDRALIRKEFGLD